MNNDGERPGTASVLENLHLRLFHGLSVQLDNALVGGQDAALQLEVLEAVARLRGLGETAIQPVAADRGGAGLLQVDL